MDPADGAGKSQADIDFGDIATRKDLGRALCLLRQRARRSSGRKLSYRDISSDLGWSHSAIGKWFAGQALPSADALDAIVHLLGASGREQRLISTARDALENPLPVSSLPQHLPPGNPKFTGRAAELEAVVGRLTQAAPGGEAITVLITGAPGVGKTAVAIHAGHRVRRHFPDGCLYADMRGFTGDRGARRTADEVVSDFLRDLGVPKLPATPEARAARYQGELASRRVLVIIDNAYEVPGTLPLLPGGAGCAALVASRIQLDGLIARGADLIQLGPLSDNGARDLLIRYLGTERVAREPAAVERLIKSSGRLPLALSVIAARAAIFRSSLASMADELHEQGLDALEAADPSSRVRESFAWSHGYLSGPEQRMFRLLSLHPGPDISLRAAADLAGIADSQAARQLEGLAAANLIEVKSCHRYALHDLILLFSREKANEEADRQERAEAIRRMLEGYLYAADAADRVLLPRFLHTPLPPAETSQAPMSFSAPGQDQRYRLALEWLDAERASLVAAIRLAAAEGMDVIAWKLAAALWGFFYLQKPWGDWIDAYKTGFQAAVRCGDTYGQAWILNGLGVAEWSRGDHVSAVGYYEQALAAWRGIGDQRGSRGSAMTLNNLAVAQAESGDLRDSLESFQRVLGARRDIGDFIGQAQTLGNIGEVLINLGRLPEAYEQLKSALDFSREVGYAFGVPGTLHNLGVAARQLGALGEALRHLREALELRREAGDKQGQASTLNELGEAYSLNGEAENARQCWQEALRIFSELGDSQATGTRARLQRLPVTSQTVPHEGGTRS